MTTEEGKIHCLRCGRRTNHELIESHEKRYTPDDDPEMEIEFAEGVWAILRCMGCDDITFRETWTTSEDRDFETGEFVPSVQLWPPRHDHYIVPRYHVDMPLDLMKLHRETIDCYNRESNILCAFGIRSLLEAICRDKSINDGPDPNRPGERASNLGGKIEGLIEARHVTPADGVLLHALRFLGNEAAHELLRPSTQELGTAIVVVEHAIASIYDQAGHENALRMGRYHRARGI